jgi:hypothetical protein
MGLMYLFPTNKDERDHVVIDDQSITLKTYGLPYIFWGYAFGILLLEFAMYLAVRSPLEKLASIGDSIDQFIYFSLNLVLLSIPLTLLCFFFYEKRLEKKGRELFIHWRFFGLTVKTQKIELKANDAFTVGHFIDSPNMARIKDEKALKGFQNKGYFELFAHLNSGKSVLIDRHSRKADLEKMIELLNTK